LVAAGNRIRQTWTVACTGASGANLSLVAEIGIPAGLAVDPASVQGLIDEGVIAFAESSQRRLVEYLDGMALGQARDFTIELIGTYAGETAPPLSRARFQFGGGGQTASGWYAGPAIRVTD
jgi:hypothetical protein